jgi:hypothetical protein
MFPFVVADGVALVVVTAFVVVVSVEHRFRQQRCHGRVCTRCLDLRWSVFMGVFRKEYYRTRSSEKVVGDFTAGLWRLEDYLVGVLFCVVFDL